MTTQIVTYDRGSGYCSIDRKIAGTRDPEDRWFWVAWTPTEDVMQGVIDDFGTLVETCH